MPNLSEQHFPIFDNSHSKKKCIVASSWNFSCSSLCSLPLVLSLFISEKSLTIKGLYTMRYIFSFFSFKCGEPMFPELSLLTLCSSPKPAL